MAHTPWGKKRRESLRLKRRITATIGGRPFAARHRTREQRKWSRWTRFKRNNPSSGLGEFQFLEAERGYEPRHQTVE